MNFCIPHITVTGRVRIFGLLFGMVGAIFGAAAYAPAALAQEQGPKPISGPGVFRTPGVFGTNEIRSSDLSAFTKWTGMLARATETAAGPGSPNAGPLANSGKCRPNPRFPCPDQALSELVDELSNKTTTEKLDGVNRFVNRVRYVTDDVNWGVADYWATPDEFFRMSGDCEDFAIAKFVALKRLGIDADRMRIVVLEDENLKTHHAVLTVETSQGRAVLDNQISQVILDTEIHHYRPIYSINETAWWLHMPIGGEPKLAQQNQ